MTDIVAIAVSDFNKDSYLEIIVLNMNTRTIGIFFGYGNGSFGEKIKLTSDSFLK